MIPGLALLALGLILSGVAAALGVAAAAVSRIELTRWVTYKLRGSGVAARLLENPGRVLATANAMTTLGIILAAAAVPALFAATTPTVLGGITLLAGVPLLLTAAYLVPRVIGRRWAEPMVARAVPALERLARVLEPVMARREPSPRTALAAVLAGADTGALATVDELSVVSGVLAFADRPVREVMTPRTDIVALPDGTPAGEAAHVLTQAGFSRYPVTGASIDEIRGVAHIFDALGLDATEPLPVRPAPAVPGTTRAADLMLEMQRGRGHLAVVLDEYGGTAGLVTFHDLLHELVGEIFGPPEGATEEGQVRLLELDGAAPVAALEPLGGAVDTRGAETVAGLLTQALGRIPRAGGRFLLGGLEFDVLAASTTRVERVLVRSGPVRPLALDPPAERGG